MAFLITAGGMTLFALVGTYLIMRSEKKHKQHFKHGTY
jgi:hypothetical protein